MYCCERDRKKVSKRCRRETRVRRIHGMCLLSSRLQHRVLVHFFQGLLTWLSPLKFNTFSALCNESKKSLLKWYPVPARLWSFDMARCSWQVRCACTIARLTGPCSLWPFSFSLKRIDAKMAWFISFPLRAFWSMILWRKRPDRKYEMHEFPVWNVWCAPARLTTLVERRKNGVIWICYMLWS